MKVGRRPCPIFRSYSQLKKSLRYRLQWSTCSLTSSHAVVTVPLREFFLFRSSWLHLCTVIIRFGTSRTWLRSPPGSRLLWQPESRQMFTSSQASHIKNSCPMAFTSPPSRASTTSSTSSTRPRLPLRRLPVPPKFVSIMFRRQ